MNPSLKKQNILLVGFSVYGQAFRCFFVGFKDREIKIKDKYGPFCFNVYIFTNLLAAVEPT